MTRSKRRISAAKLERRYAIAMATTRALFDQAARLTERTKAFERRADERGLGWWPGTATLTELNICASRMHCRAMRVSRALADQREREFNARFQRHFPPASEHRSAVPAVAEG